MSHRIVALVIVLLIALSCGCSSKKGAISDDSGAMKVTTTGTGEKKETQVEIEGKKEKVKITGSNDKPEEWPDDVPFYPGASIEGSASISGTKDEGVTVALSSHDSVEKVVSYYEGELKANSWNAETNVTSSGNEGKNALMVITKDNRTGTVIIRLNDQDKITKIAIHIGKNQ